MSKHSPRVHTTMNNNYIFYNKNLLAYSYCSRLKDIVNMRVHYAFLFIFFLCVNFWIFQQIIYKQ